MSPREIQEIKDGGKPTVDLVFKVWAPKLNRLTHRLYLLGSLKQMGAWNIQEAVQGKPTSDFHTWRVDIRDVPIETIFEWSWVKAKPNRTDVKWERMVKRNRTVDCFGGVIHTIYGDGEEVFVQSATYAEVTTYRKVEQGQLLVLTGSTHTTGSWDLDKAVNATECPISSGYWKVHVAFDPGSGLEFKWAIVKENPRKLHILEKETHLIQGRQSWLRVVAPWNVSRVFIEDTPICLEPLDHVTGRTDVLVNAKKAHTESIRHWLKKDPRANTPALLPIKNVPAPKTAPFNVTTPRITNEHKAKEALKKFMSMSGSGPAKLSTGNVANRVPTVQPLENVADHVKKRSESIRGSERVNKEQERNPFKAGMSIKGKGQTHLARSSTAEMMKEQPLVDATVLNLIHLTETRANKSQIELTGDGSTSTLLTSSMDSKTSTRTSTKASNRTTKFAPGSDQMILQMKQLEFVLKELEMDPGDERQGLAAIEKDISAIESYPPPTWSMLTEAEMIKTCNPVLPPSKKTVKVKEFVKPEPPAPVTTTLRSIKSIPAEDSTPLSLAKANMSPDSFKPRTGIPGASRVKQFTLTTGTGKEMSSVGMDDTMKTDSDLKLEQANRKMWEKRL